MKARRRTVLVIEDEEPIRKVLNRLLTQAGYEVKLAPDGRQALQMVQTTSVPDVIVLDLIMPIMSGFEVLSALRVIPEWANIPVVVLTGSLGYTAPHLHADALLNKPFDSVSLQAAIDTAIAAKAKPAPG